MEVCLRCRKSWHYASGDHIVDPKKQDGQSHFEDRQSMHYVKILS